VVHRCLSCDWSVFGSVILNQWCVCTVLNDYWETKPYGTLKVSVTTRSLSVII